MKNVYAVMWKNYGTNSLICICETKEGARKYIKRLEKSDKELDSIFAKKNKDNHYYTKDTYMVMENVW